MGDKNIRTILIGLDGATWDLIKSWVDEEKLPTFKKLMENGVWGNLESTIPPYSPISWNSIYTGVWQTKHGIFGSFKRDKKSYHLVPVSSKDRKVKAIWNILTLFNKHSILINMPFTYPPEKIKGIMITGLGTPDKNSNFTYPYEFKEYILNNYPEYDIDFNEEKLFYTKDKDWLLQKIESVTNAQILLSKELLKNEKWDLFFIVFRASDVLQHYFWYNKEVIFNFYKKIDDYLDFILNEIMDQNTVLFLCSDHGFSEVKKSVYIGNWLEKKGYFKIKKRTLNVILEKLNIDALKLKKLLSTLGVLSYINKIRDKKLFKTLLEKIPNPEYGEIFNADWSKTVAYFFYGSDGEIYLNIKGREPQGIVTEKEYHKIIDKLKKELMEIVDPDTGEKVLRKVITKKDILGEHFNILDDIPDLFLLKNDKYKLSGYNPKSKSIFGPPVVGSLERPGDHSLYGIFLAYGNIIQNGIQIHPKVIDLMPTILALLDLPIPEYVDGNVLWDIFTENYRVNLKIKYISEKEMRLRDIGSKISKINLKIKNLGDH